jgi:hypothetical protein
MFYIDSLGDHERFWIAIRELMIAFLASSIRLDSLNRSFSPGHAEIAFDASISLDSEKDSDGD